MLDVETTQIRRPVPPLIRKALEERKITEDAVIIATNTDLDIAGEYSERWLVVTKEFVFVFMLEEEENEALLIRELPISKIETARTDSRVGSGFLEAKTSDNVFEELIRFSNKNAEKFSKVATKIRSLAEGKQVVVRPEEEEELVQGRCRKCGIRLPDRSMTVCPKCMKRGLVFLRFLARTKEYWPLATLGMILVVASIFLNNLVPPALTQILLDNVFADPGTHKQMPGWFLRLTKVFALTTREQWLFLVVATLAATTLTAVAIGWMRERLAVWVNNRLGYDLRRDVFQKMEDLAVRYHDKHPVGASMTRCSQDVEALQGFINQLTGGFGYQIILVVAMAFAMFMTSWKLALIACLPAPVVMTCTVWFYKLIIPAWNKYWTTRSDLSNVLHASLSGVRVIKAFAQEKREGERFKSYSAKFRDAGLHVGYSQALFYPVMGFVFQLGSYFIWIIGGIIVLNGLAPGATSELTIGQLMKFLGYLGMFYAPLNSLTQMSNWFTSFTTQAHRVFEVLDHEPEISETADAIDMQIQGAISFKNVIFGYDPHIPVLHDMSFDVRPGEMIGVVGHSGCGKSTTVNLIMRFYDVNEGMVTIDNIDIRRIRKICLRRQIGMVPQDAYLFGGTIAENIAYGNPSVAPELILDAALAANAHMFITRIHDGYDTRLGERGSGLSGGERQRVAISRALLYNPRILILDEATSSVDTIAEREIQKALESLSLGRTTIAVAHRLSTLRNCDRILVFEEGMIREHGTHEELLALNGIYKKLVDIQTQLTSDRQTSVDELKTIEEIKKAEEVKVVTEQKKKERTPPDPVPRIRYLEPRNLHIYALDEGGLHVSYNNEKHDHVHAYRCFPVSHPSEFIALWTGSSALEHHEIGMIRRLKELAPSSLLAVQHELAKRYFIHYVHKINSIVEELGFLSWDVDTDKGRMQFMTRRWDRYTVAEGGPNGRIIVDVDYNRYEIEDLTALDSNSRSIFFKYIYW
jgi:ATP-binding cassette subfamily B protein